MELHFETSNEPAFRRIEQILAKQVNASAITYTKESVTGAIALVIQKDKCYIKTEVAPDTTAQKEQLLKDLEYNKGFLISVEKKLGNERFVANAKPEIVAIEQKKKADAEDKIKAIEESLKLL
ncbi:hypothetical protein MKQ70_02060 [Chitinophaga sedimenti]|uniref:hypothetical protein n=1 Tax=Chitinophaga sedimenti TaxID=2033606 RepID=UPI0020038DE3|nr:hypothetical protein [Chitinophaga sedimenti]MCK7553854.1 hypothetical protein [Chitinophaga sedimenti]